MNGSRTLMFHAGLLVLGAGAATWAYTRDKTAGEVREIETTIWSLRAGEVTEILFEGKDRKVVIAPQKDKDPYYLVSVEKTPPSAAPDAGAPPASKATTVFVSNDASKKVVEALAPLRVLRSMGKPSDDKTKEYGLDKSERSITIRGAGKERKLAIGDTTPGGLDAYVADAASGEAYVIKGEFLRSVESAESSLMEHELHGWKENEVKSAKLTASGKTRNIVRGGPEGRKAWADPGAPDKADETVVNWMQKLERLRPMEYSEKDPDNRTVVVRVEYGGSGPLGFLELAKSPDPADAAKSIFWVLTERTHRYAKVYAGTAEQVEQDLASVLK